MSLKIALELANRYTAINCLQEFSVFDGSADTTRIATFLGLPAPAYHVPFPRVGGKKMKRFSRSALERAMEVSRPQISMCITGQIRRLELHSKAVAFRTRAPTRHLR